MANPGLIPSADAGKLSALQRTMTRPALSIQHVAKLARLELTPDEAASMQAQLDQILTHIDKLRELDLGPAAPESQPPPDPPRTRADEPHPGLAHEAALANAPLKTRGQFVVPRILDVE
jgi:aspartyl-tRNA(Asn)/glutamyl-tRNA(Gln) amidotransferase subunit C